MYVVHKLSDSEAVTMCLRWVNEYTAIGFKMKVYVRKAMNEYLINKK
jgi:hypothetical protein